MRAVRTLADRARRRIDDDAGGQIRSRACDEPVREHPHDTDRRIGARKRRRRGSRLGHKLGCHGGPCRVFVDAFQLDAVNARPDTRLHERADSHESITEHDGKMRHITTEPSAMLGGGNGEIRDDHCASDRGDVSVGCCNDPNP
jgi:hypothetical protein